MRRTPPATLWASGQFPVSELLPPVREARAWLMGDTQTRTCTRAVLPAPSWQAGPGLNLTPPLGWSRHTGQEVAPPRFFNRGVKSQSKWWWGAEEDAAPTILLKDETSSSSSQKLSIFSLLSTHTHINDTWGSTNPQPDDSVGGALMISKFHL